MDIPKGIHIVATHEAAHVVCNYLLGIGFSSVTISAMPNGEWEGEVEGCRSNFEVDKYGDSKELAQNRYYAENLIIFKYAGLAAEVLLIGEESVDEDTCMSDLRTACDISFEVCGDEEEASLFCKWLLYRAKKMVSVPARWFAIRKLADALVEKHSMTEDECIQVIQHAFQQYVNDVN